jgi:hypothetical protein
VPSLFFLVLALAYIVPLVGGLALCLSRGWRMWWLLAVGVPIAYGVVVSIIFALDRREAGTVPCSEASDCYDDLGLLLFVAGPIAVWSVAAAISAAVLSLKSRQRRKRAAAGDGRTAVGA